MMKSKFRHIKDTISSYNKFALIFGIVACSKAIGFIPTLPDFLSYTLNILFALYCIFKSKRLDFIFATFLFYIATQLLVLDCPPIFNVWLRFGLFIVMLLCISPILQSNDLIRIRKQIWNTCIIFCEFIAIGSFICFFLGINFMKRGEFDGIIDVGLFGGLCKHSMLLGPIAALSTISLAFVAYRFKSMIYACLAFMSICSVLFSASRSALISTLAGLVVMIYFESRDRTTFFKAITLIILIASTTFPLWQNATDFIAIKQSNNTDNGSMFFSREKKWENRIAEFKSSPIIGLGFDVVSTHTNDYSPYTGNIEPGSSILASLSMLGLVGTAFIAIIFYRSLHNARKTSNSDKSFLIGTSMFFLSHMLAEGYLFSAGSFLFFLVWLNISISYDLKLYHNDCHFFKSPK